MNLIKSYLASTILLQSKLTMGANVYSGQPCGAVQLFLVSISQKWFWFQKWNRNSNLIRSSLYCTWSWSWRRAGLNERDFLLYIAQPPKWLLNKYLSSLVARTTTIRSCLSAALPIQPYVVKCLKTMQQLVWRADQTKVQIFITSEFKEQLSQTFPLRPWKFYFHFPKLSMAFQAIQARALSVNAVCPCDPIGDIK